MPIAKIVGLEIAYEIVGDGPKNAVITPGGRFPKETPGIRAMAEELAGHGYRVLIWDRPNCGASEVCFDAENESTLNADVLAGLLRELNMAPALVFGGSAGSRVSLICAHRHPEVVEKLVLCWITGGWTGLAELVRVYCGELLVAAKTGGMEAVADSQWLAECVVRNPSNRARILALDPEVFCETMEVWGKSYLPEGGSPVPGLLPGDFARIAMPVLVFRGGRSDYSHPRRTTEQVHALLPNAILAEPPWGDREWIERVADAANGLFRRFPLLVPQIVEFGHQSH